MMIVTRYGICVMTSNDSNMARHLLQFVIAHRVSSNKPHYEQGNAESSNTSYYEQGNTL